MISKFLLPFLIFSLTTHAAIKPLTFKKSLKAHKRELKNITKDIYSLEANIGKGNKKYLKILKRRKALETQIITLETQIKKDKSHAEKKKQVTKKRLKQALVESLSGSKTPGQLLGHKLIVKMLKDQLRSWNKFQSTSANLLKKLITSKQKYSNFRQIESDLLSLMNDMEDSKREKSIRYVELKKKKNDLQSKLKITKTKKKALKAKISLITERFARPINSIVNLEYEKKGVTFKFDRRQPVKTSRNGKIIHTGSLSTYGNVVMIDHGNDVRSIYLGQFLPTVKKGQSVITGETLGNTFDVAKNEGKLYFEVRKKNKAQNTILLLDKNLTKKLNKIRRL